MYNSLLTLVDTATTVNNILVELGLTENEAKIYTEFVGLPPTSAASIARKLHMDKSSAYKAVEHLQTRGLLVHAGWEKAYLYKASSPESLNELLNEKQAALEIQKQNLKTFVGNLKEHALNSRSTYISHESGLEALEKRMTESLECKEKVIRERYRYHSFFDVPDHVSFIMDYAKERVKRKIFMKQLEPQKDILIKRAIPLEASPGLKLKEIINNPKRYCKEIRAFPEQLCDNNSLRIWDDYVNIISFDDQSKFIVITIYDKFVAEMMKNMFDFIWEKCEPY